MKSCVTGPLTTPYNTPHPYLSSLFPFDFATRVEERKACWTEEGHLHTRAKSRDHDIVTAQNKSVHKLPSLCRVVVGPQV